MALIKLLLELFFVFFKIGLFTIGGGYAMIPMIEDEVVMQKGWITSSEILNFLAISESTPGPFAINTATLIGFQQAGILGGIVATLGVVMPSFLIIYIIAKFMSKFSENYYVKSVFKILKPVIIGLLMAVVVSLVSKNLFIGEEAGYLLDWKAIVIMVVILTLSQIFKKAHPVLLIFISGVLGYIFYGLIP